MTHKNLRYGRARAALVHLAISMLLGSLATAPSLSASESFPEPNVEVLLLGTFHFRDAGLDDYKPQHEVDIFSAKRQQEVAALLDHLAAFKPNKVAVEVRASRQSSLDESYRAYLAGDKELTSNEIHQLGFRLGKRLELGSIIAVDAPARRFESSVDASEWAMRNGQAKALTRGRWERHYRALYEAEDAAKLEQTLIEHLLEINSPERIRVGHGHYLVGSTAVGDGEAYPGADGMTWWYNRNLRIFSNILRATEPGDRVVVIIGAGHLSILQHAIDASPDLRLVPVESVLSAN